MASNIDNSVTFKALAAAAALLLACAAVLVFFQAGGASPSAPKLAALSQLIPSQAESAMRGASGAFDALDRSVKDVASLRRNGDAPGRAADWQKLESQAAAILAKRKEVETLTAAATRLQIDAASMVELSDELLNLSGATAIMQEFQQRANRVRETALSLPAGGENAASAIAEDIGFLRNVASALEGSPSDLDVRPLDEAGRAAALVPILSSLTSMERQSIALPGNISIVGALAESSAELAASADTLLNSAFASSGSSPLPGFLRSSLIPVAMLVIALLLVLSLFALHAKSSVFERVAKEQADQNDRNQQAILRLLDEMGSLADGDLTVEATVTEDITGTIADSFNFAIEELRKLVATVNNTAMLVDTATKQTENTAAHLAKAADNQGKEINAATESIVSMAASIEEVSGNAERSSDVARHSVEVAHKGGEAVRRTIDGMNAIRETIQDTSKRIKRLGESSQEIGNIVELINDIAEQTNILALNASIQASMAGEAGRGFAVVADEVQRLAERSTNATKQIEVLVRTIQSDTNEAVVSMERSTTDVVGGALLAENAGAALDEIEQVSNQIASLVQNISSSARQQAGSAADVTRRTTRLREIGEQTAQATTATAASISKLSELATQLRKTVEGFTLPAEMMQASSLARTTTNAETTATSAALAVGDQAISG
jgi:twitching motility protein PilJ